MDTKIRKLLTRNKMHHPKVDVDCLDPAGRKVNKLQNCNDKANEVSKNKRKLLKVANNYEKKNFHLLSYKSNKFESELN